LYKEVIEAKRLDMPVARLYEEVMKIAHEEVVGDWKPKIPEYPGVGKMPRTPGWMSEGVNPTYQ